MSKGRKRRFNAEQRLLQSTRHRFQSAELNDQQQLFYEVWITELSCSRFTWQNLPDEVSPRFMELMLYYDGLAVFFREGVFYDKYFCTQATALGRLNVYYDPKGFTAYGPGGFHKRMSAKNCVPIWNNYTRTPTWLMTQIYARRLANIDRTFDVNLNMQKMPAFVRCEESQKLTVQNLIDQWQGNAPIIFGDNLSLQGVELGYITPNIDYKGDQLLAAKTRVWAEMMSWLGINNAPQEKKERVQTAEVEANDEQIEASRLSALDCRREACKAINRKYGLDVWCDANTDFSSANFAAITALPALNIIGGEAL